MTTRPPPTSSELPATYAQASIPSRNRSSHRFRTNGGPHQTQWQGPWHCCRRCVAQSLAQKYAQPIHTACQPHQFALATRSGTEAVVHALTAVTEANPTHTILSVDGVGAYDNISRNSMLQGFRDVPEANRCLPFVKMFYGAPSHYIWHSATGEAHIILKQKVVNRATHSCPPYSPSASDPPFTRYNNISYPTSLCLPSSTTSTLWCHPTESAQSTTPWPTPSKAKPASASTKEKPACGTQLASNHRTSGPRGRCVGWQPNFTSYIPGHDRPRGPHRLSRFCSAPTPTCEPTPSTSPRPHPSSRGSPGLLVAVTLLCQS